MLANDFDPTGAKNDPRRSSSDQESALRHEGGGKNEAKNVYYLFLYLNLTFQLERLSNDDGNKASELFTRS